MQDLGWRLQHGLLPASLRPRAFFVLIGTNDLGAGEDWGVVATELELVLSQLHHARPAADVVVHTILPRGGDEGVARSLRFHRSSWWTAAHNNHFDAITKLNARLRAFAARHRQWLHVADCSDSFIARAVQPADQLSASAMPRNAAANGTRAAAAAYDDAPRYLPTHLMYDLLHLTPDGYAQWAACLRPQLAAVFGGRRARQLGSQLGSQLGRQAHAPPARAGRGTGGAGVQAGTGTGAGGAEK